MYSVLSFDVIVLFVWQDKYTNKTDKGNIYLGSMINRDTNKHTHTHTGDPGWDVLMQSDGLISRP